MMQPATNMPTPKAGDTVTGAAGWMSLDGCQAPLFQFKPGADQGSLTDVTIAIERYRPTAR